MGFERTIRRPAGADWAAARLRVPRRLRKVEVRILKRGERVDANNCKKNRLKIGDSSEGQWIMGII